MITWIAVASCLLAVAPTILFLRNLLRYRPLPPQGASLLACSVLIPARNEAANIANALKSVLDSENIEFEVIVLDDQSQDATSNIVNEFAAVDLRVRLETAQPLPADWIGKNSACHQLAGFARYPLLVFMDADVRVSRPESLARLAQFAEKNGSALISGVPREETAGLLEKMIVPLIHFVLLGFLPLGRMRSTTDPRFAAACGQILAVRRVAYEQTGGHAAIANRIHDAVALARHFRSHGLTTDLFDATDTFHCRMYHRASEVWNGFSKNAHEGLGSGQLIVPATLLLLGGQVLPLILLALTPSALTLIASVAVLLPRLIAVCRFRQSLLGALLHPLGICLLVAIQWDAFFRSLRKRPAVWKGRSYSPASAA
ncbi:MAG: glycosyltransferase family 2 protein [Chthoniobacterales bacterium]